jgi:cyclic pyranopterin monophosphate synthase
MPKPAKESSALSHVDRRGRVQMVDVGEKVATRREAVAEGDVRMSPAALRAIRQRAVKKGDPLQTARLAGIMAAKRTSDIVPLCHPLPLTYVDVELVEHRRGYTVTGRAATVGRTGVEMEALVAVAAASLTLYDMLKAIDKSIVIGPIVLREKRGGRSGDYSRPKTRARRRRPDAPRRGDA